MSRPIHRTPVRSRLAVLVLLMLFSLLAVQIDNSIASADSHRPVPVLAGQVARAQSPWSLFLPLILSPFRYDWPQFNADPQHSGNDQHETLITAGNVASLQRIFRATLPDNADGAPVYLANVSTSSGPRDMLFLTTVSGKLLALDAQTGSQIWTADHGDSGCAVNGDQGNGPCFTTSQPAIDPDRQYVYSYGVDGYVHKHRVGDGGETIGGGWPALTTQKNFDEKGSSDLSVATARDGTRYLYVVQAGYPGDPGDAGDYQGHLTAINLSTGQQHIFNALCSDQADVHFVEEPGKPDCPQDQAGIWSRAGVVYDPARDRIYATTGNGDFKTGSNAWGDTLFALAADGSSTGQPLDSYTPANYQALQSNDYDLGSTTAALLPPPANSVYQHLALQGGKDRSLHLINLDNMSGQGGPGFVGGELAPVFLLPVGGEMHTAPAVWVNPQDGSTWVFASAWYGIVGMQLTVDGNGKPSLSVRWTSTPGGTSPVVVNNILFYAASYGVYAADPVSGKRLWQTTQIGSLHWESPIVANGVLYLADEGRGLSAFGLPSIPN